VLEQNLLSHASRGNASSIKLELEPAKHSGIFLFFSTALHHYSYFC